MIPPVGCLRDPNPIHGFVLYSAPILSQRQLAANSRSTCPLSGALTLSTLYNSDMSAARLCRILCVTAVLVTCCLSAPATRGQTDVPAPVSAQQHTLPSQYSAGKIVLDVLATDKSGELVSGLQQQDFTVLDNKVPRALTSFRAVDGRTASIKIVLLVDTVNTDYSIVSFEREQLDKFLRADQGRLAYPMSLAFLTDSGLQIQNDFSTDGNALSASLDQYTVALRTVRRDAGFWGADERLQYSLDGLYALAAREPSRPPGRTLILCLSPGWPLLSGPNVELDSKGQEQILANVIGFSNLLLEGRITLYSIDPSGAGEAGSERVSYWQEFVKGVSKRSQAQIADLALQVLATQSGGVALNSNNDVTALVQKCVRDTAVYYELSFDPPPDEPSNQYHHLEIHVAKPGVTARARQGYYSHPPNAPSTPLPRVHVRAAGNHQ